MESRIGETIKAVDDKTQKNFLKDYPQIPWAKVIGLRNNTSHEYANIDYEIILGSHTKTSFLL